MFRVGRFRLVVGSLHRRIFAVKNERCERRDGVLKNGGCQQRPNILYEFLRVKS